MVRCHLSLMTGEHRMNLADTTPATGLRRNTITLLYQETATRVDRDAIDRLGKLFTGQAGEMPKFQDLGLALDRLIPLDFERDDRCIAETLVMQDSCPVWPECSPGEYMAAQPCCISVKV